MVNNEVKNTKEELINPLILSQDLLGADTDLDEEIPLLQLESQHVPVPSLSEIKSLHDKKV
jgi:hypothetical protein